MSAAKRMVKAIEIHLYGQDPDHRGKQKWKALWQAGFRGEYESGETAADTPRRALSTAISAAAFSMENRRRRAGLYPPTQRNPKIGFGHDPK